MSLVTVMMWQPIASAWKMLSSSRGLAQISSGAGRGAQDLAAAAHDRHRIAPGVGDPAGEDRDVARRAVAERLRRRRATCARRHERGDVELDALGGQAPDDGADAARRGCW